MSSMAAGAAPFSFKKGVVFCSSISFDGAADGMTGAVPPVAVAAADEPAVCALSSLSASW